MLIKKDLTITVTNGGSSASLNEPLYIFMGDKNIDIYFTIVDNKFAFSNNLLENTDASYAIIKVLKPNGAKFMSSRLDLVNSKVVFSITSDFADEITEIGTHKLQIHLYDSNNGRITIPKIEFEVLNPIFRDEEASAMVSCNRVNE